MQIRWFRCRFVLQSSKQLGMTLERPCLLLGSKQTTVMNKFWYIFVVLPLLTFFPQLSSGQGIQVAPALLSPGDIFTVTAFGTNIYFPLTFGYNNGGPISTVAQSPTTTAVFTFSSGASVVGVYNDYSNNFMRIAPTSGGPNSVAVYIPPISLGQQSAIISFIGNFAYPIGYLVTNMGVGTITDGILLTGTSTIVFNAPESFSIRVVATNLAISSFTVRIAVTPFVGITVNPSLILTTAPVTVTVSPTANSDAPITYMLLDSNGGTALSVESPVGDTMWQFNAPAAAGVYQFSVINGVDGGVPYGLAYTALTVMTPPVIVQPIPGASLLAGSSVTASIFGYDPASSYTLSFVNGVFAYVTIVPGAVSMPILPVPSNYLGQMYLTAAQNDSINVATYTISVARAVYNVRGNLRRRAHIGG
jgi:hypothetical protein